MSLQLIYYFAAFMNYHDLSINHAAQMEASSQWWGFLKFSTHVSNCTWNGIAGIIFFLLSEKKNSEWIILILLQLKFSYCVLSFILSTCLDINTYKLIPVFKYWEANVQSCAVSLSPYMSIEKIHFTSYNTIRFFYELGKCFTYYIYID